MARFFKQDAGREALRSAVTQHRSLCLEWNSATSLPMREVAKLLTKQLDHTVLDHTGLTGDYDFTLNWTPDKTQPAGLRGPESNQSGPSIFTAIRQQLGLKLEPQNVPMEVLAIDHAERPSEN